MASASTIAVVIAGLAIGLLLGLTGGGGSILTVPLLVYVIGLEAKIAIATSLLVVGAASLAAMIAHARAGNVYWRTGLMFGAAGMAGAYFGGAVAQFISDAVLLLLFAGVMIGSGMAMIRRKRPLAEAHAGGATAGRHLLKVLSDGFVVGIVTGLVGAGGGFLIVPALALLGGLPMHAAVGTSLLVIAMNCLAGLAGHVFLAHVPVDMHAALIVGLFAVLGTAFGSRVAAVIPAHHLRRGFGVFVLVIAAILIVIEGSGVIARAFGVDRRAAGEALTVLAVLTAVPMVIKATRALRAIGPTS